MLNSNRAFKTLENEKRPPKKNKATDMPYAVGPREQYSAHYKHHSLPNKARKPAGSI